VVATGGRPAVGVEGRVLAARARWAAAAVARFDAVRGATLPPGAPPGLGPTLRELFGYYERAPEPFEAAALWARLGPPRVGFEAFADAVGREPADKTAIRTGLREP